MEKSVEPERGNGWLRSMVAAAAALAVGACVVTGCDTPTRDLEIPSVEIDTNTGGY